MCVSVNHVACAVARALSLACVALACMAGPSYGAMVNLVPDGVVANPGGVTRQRVTDCAAITTNLHPALDENIVAGASDFGCIAGTQAADFIEKDLTTGSSVTVDFSLTDFAPVGAKPVHSIELHWRTCAEVAGDEANLALYQADGTTLITAVNGMAISSICGSTWNGFRIVPKHLGALTDAQLDGMIARLTLRHSGGAPAGNHFIRVSAINVRPIYCTAAQEICGNALDSMNNTRTAWTGCRGGVNPDLALRLSGGGTATTSCDVATGEFAFTTAMAAGERAVVYMNRGIPLGAGATYIEVDQGGEHVDVAPNNVYLDAYPHATASLTNAEMSFWDGSNDAQIPIDVTGSALVESQPVSLFLQERMTYLPGGDVTASYIGLDRNTNVTNSAGSVITLKGSGLGSSCATPATRQPLCRGANSTMTNPPTSTVRFTGTSNYNIARFTYGILEIMPPSGTPTVTGNNDTLNASTLTIGGAGGSPDVNFGGFTTTAVTGTTTLNAGATLRDTTSAAARTSTFAGSFTGAGTVNITSSFRSTVLRGSGAASFGQTVAGTDWVFSSLALENSSGAARTVSSPTPGGSGKIVATNLTVGRASDTANTIFDVNTNDRAVTVGGTATITTRGVLSASSAQPLSLLNDFVRNGSFVHNNGPVTVMPTTDGVSRLAYAGATTFFDLSLVGPGEVEFDNVDQTDVVGSFVATSTDCTTPDRLWLASDVDGSQWEVNATGTKSVSNVAVRDSNAVAAIVGTMPTLDGGNNAGWTFAPQAGCGSPAPDSFLTQGATQPVNVTAATPTFSFVNRSGGSVDRRHTQVYATLPDNVAGLWHFDGSGAAAFGGAASLNSGAVATGSAQPEFGQSLQLDGVDDHAAIASVPALQIASNFTVDAWFRTPALAGTSAVLLQRSSGTGCATNCNYSVSIDLVNNRVCGQTTIAGVLASTCSANGTSTAWIDNSWHHVAFVREFNAGTHTQAVYVDGLVVAGPSVVSGPADTAAAALTIGRATSGGSMYAGLIDEVRVHSAAMSAAEVDGYARAHRPHATVLWDSSPSGVGVAMVSCADAVRCANIVYGTGGGSVELRRDGARYYVRSRARASTDVWSEWGSDWFEMEITPAISVSAGSIDLGAVIPGSDVVGSTNAQVTTSDDRGYVLLGSYPTALPGNGSGGTVASFVPAPPGTPASVWTAGTSQGLGITVLGASGGAAARLPIWGPGTGTPANDFVNNHYAGLAVGTTTLLHRRTTMYALTDTINLAIRVNVDASQPVGIYNGTVALTALTNP